ncbi:hypothetical protein GJAV_G00231500 [Gymnothorax javanicus]|nr:hypothetical protein GJAV_G00231500 [Gymnothorax javanicus]
MVEAKPKKRRSNKCMSRKKERDRSYAKSRINIGKAYQRWREFRELNGFNSDAQVALFLLDRNTPQRQNRDGDKKLKRYDGQESA